MSTGDFVAFNTAFAQFLFASAGITTAFTTILQAAPFYERAKPILRTLPEVDTEKPDPGVLRGRVEINHVSFRYDPDGPLVLDDVSLRAEPGEFVAIVGRLAPASRRSSGSCWASRSPRPAPSTTTTTTWPSSTSRRCAARWGWCSRTAG